MAWTFQIIGVFDNLGYPSMVIIKSDTGGGENLSMSRSRIVGELDGEELIALLVLAIPSVLNVGEEFAENIHILP